jgi:hypothetical protein
VVVGAVILSGAASAPPRSPWSGFWSSFENTVRGPRAGSASIGHLLADDLKSGGAYTRDERLTPSSCFQMPPVAGLTAPPSSTRPGGGPPQDGSFTVTGSQLACAQNIRSTPGAWTQRSSSRAC